MKATKTFNWLNRATGVLETFTAGEQFSGGDESKALALGLITDSDDSSLQDEAAAAEAAAAEAAAAEAAAAEAAKQNGAKNAGKK